MNRGRWDILTGEYPPTPGGVSDYTRLVADGLARAGCEVHVWTGEAPAGVDAPDDAGVSVHREAGRWSPVGLDRLGRELGPTGRRRLLVQYTPNAWGRKGLNFGFCRWVAARGQGGDFVRLMFHEIRYYTRLLDRPTRWPLPTLHRAMVRRILTGASRVDYATEEWGRQLRAFPEVRGTPLEWQPVPSNIPVVDDPEGVAAVRRRFAPRGELVVGNFATFPDDHRRRLRGIFARTLLNGGGRVGLLIGRNGGRFAGELVAAHPSLAGRVFATGALGAADVSRHLRACDLLIQPYPDGLCARRGTATAALAHGLPMATTRGSFTEPLFDSSGCAALAPIDEPGGLSRVTERLLADGPARDALGRLAKATYDRHFTAERTVGAILSGATADPEATAATVGERP